MYCNLKKDEVNDLSDVIICHILFTRVFFQHKGIHLKCDRHNDNNNTDTLKPNNTKY